METKIRTLRNKRDHQLMARPENNKEKPFEFIHTAANLATNSAVTTFKCWLEKNFKWPETNKFS
jgi:hypothetical protein